MGIEILIGLAALAFFVWLLLWLAKRV